MGEHSTGFADTSQRFALFSQLAEVSQYRKAANSKNSNIKKAIQFQFSIKKKFRICNLYL